MTPYSNEWFPGTCPTCGRGRHVREFPAYGVLCLDCYFAKGREMRFARRKSKGNPVSRISYGAVRRLGSVTRSVRDGFQGVGRFIKGAPNALSETSRAMKRVPQRAAAPLPVEAIRSMIIEESARMRVADGETTPPELDERLQFMAAAIQALQRRVDELGPGGSIISEAVMWKEVGSLQAAESLTSDEQALLVNVFRQNVAIQKPEIAKAGKRRSAKDRS